MTYIFLAVAVFFTVLAITTPCPKDDKPAEGPSLGAKIEVLDNSTGSQPQDPVPKLTRIERDVRGKLTWELGYRVHNDIYLGYVHGKRMSNFPSYALLLLTFTAPDNRTACTFVEITCQPDSGIGKRRISGGGIGQNWIQFIVDTYYRLFFECIAQVYGI